MDARQRVYSVDYLSKIQNGARRSKLRRPLYLIDLRLIIPPDLRKMHSLLQLLLPYQTIFPVLFRDNCAK